MGDGEANYVSTTIWKDRASFDAWMSSEKKPSPKPSGGGGGGPPPIYARPPVPTFYEGILMLESGKGV